MLNTTQTPDHATGKNKPKKPTVQTSSIILPIQKKIIKTQSMTNANGHVYIAPSAGYNVANFNTMLNKVLYKFKNKETFTVTDVVKYLNRSRSYVYTLLDGMLKENAVIRTGHHHTTKYSINPDVFHGK